MKRFQQFTAETGLNKTEPEHGLAREVGKNAYFQNAEWNLKLLQTRPRSTTQSPVI